MKSCISCSNSTTQRFKVSSTQGKLLCNDCRNRILKSKPDEVIWFRSHCQSNLCCQNCFRPATLISDLNDIFQVICSECSTYSDKIVPMEWFDLIMLKKDAKIYDDRISLLLKYDKRCEEIIESFEHFIVSMTGMYNSCKDQINQTSCGNLDKIEGFERDLARALKEVMKSGGNVEQQVFLKNLEAIQNEIIGLELVSAEKLKETILENVDIIIDYTQNFEYLL